MGLSVGIIGLPNVGKSTLFNALTRNQVEAENYPFCTIDPNVGIVAVPDERLDKLASVIKTEKIVPAVVEFVDIAGLVRGASQGEGLGNKFLSHVRSCDAIVEVVRIFEDEKVHHVEGKLVPLSDIETIQTELILADLETVQKAISKTEKEVKKEQSLATKLNFLCQIEKSLNDNLPVREIEATEKERDILDGLHLLTDKPHLYLINGDEKHLKDFDFHKYALQETETIVMSAKIEAELNQLDSHERKEYLQEIGQKEPALNNLIRKSFSLLGLQTYFTAGEKEIKAWTIHQGDLAPQAAGVIHGDFEKGFIKAEVVNWQDLVECGSWQKARENGKVRLEGRDYQVRDGDTIIFKFSN